MIGFLANTIGNWQLGRKFLKTNRVSKALNLSEMNSAILIFDLVDQKGYQRIIDFVKLLKSENVKQIEVIGYSKEKETPTYVNFSVVNVLNNQEINWLGIPSEKFAGAILDTTFDLMVDFTMEDVVPTRYLLALVNAKTKVGSPQKGRDEYFDLLVDVKDEGVEEYQQNVVHFLKMINKL